MAKQTIHELRLRSAVKNKEAAEERLNNAIRSALAAGTLQDTVSEITGLSRPTLWRYFINGARDKPTAQKQAAAAKRRAARERRKSTA